MSQHGALTPKQVQFVALVCQGQNHTDIAKALEVDRKTLSRWSKLPHIQEAIAQTKSRQTEAVAQQQGEQYRQITKAATLTTHELIEKLTPAAVKVVGSILARQDARDTDRLKAAELLAKWSGLGQTASQPQQTGEQILNLYLNNIAANPHAND